MRTIEEYRKCLGARIADIKADGYIVYTEMVTDPATGKRYARYSM